MVLDHLSKKLQVTEAAKAIDLGIHVKLLFYPESVFHLPGAESFNSKLKP